MKLTHIVKFNGNHYLVDSCYTWDCGYETMVFRCDSKGNVKNWHDLFVAHYQSESEMQQGHMQIVTDIKAGRMTFND